MGNIKQINVKNQTYYFFSDMINIKVFDSSLLKIEKKSYKNIGIYKNKEVLKKPTKLWDEIKNKIEIINDGECKYGKDFTKIKFGTDDDLLLNKPLNLHMLTIIVRSVFEDEVIFYPQVYLDECLYEL